MTEFQSKFAPATAEQIADFEREIGYVLPDEYKRFLCMYNGGRPTLCVFDFPAQNDVDVVDEFYGITGDEYSDLLEWRTIYRGRIPDHLLAIACDPGGNQICISVSGDDYGRIYFWDHELEHTGTGAVFPLADSFDQFVSSLRAD